MITAGAGYYAVDELPVEVTSDGHAFQWSSGRPEAFSLLRVAERGMAISERQWRELIQTWKLGW